MRSRLGRMSAASRRRLPRVRPSLLLRSRTRDGQATDIRRAGIRLMPTFCDIPRWAAARGGWTCHGLATDGRHTDAHGLCTDCTRACLRTSDGRATGGHWSDLDESSYFEMGGGAAGGLPTGLSRTIPLRTDNGRQTDRQRTQTGGGRAGIRLLPTFCDIPRWAAAWRTWDGLLTGGRRTAGAGRRPRTFDGRRIA